MPTIEEVGVFLTAFKQLKETSELIIDPKHLEPRKEGEPTHCDAVFGSTRIIIDGRDSEILAKIPKKHFEMLEKGGMILDTQVDGLVQFWVKLKELNKEIGSWLYVEIQYNPGELEFCPNGESARAYCKAMAMIAAYGVNIDADKWTEFVKSTYAND